MADDQLQQQANELAQTFSSLSPEERKMRLNQLRMKNRALWLLVKSALNALGVH